MVANEVLKRKDLSLKAKGLFAYLFSKPSDWDFAATRIATECKEDRKAILAGLQELEAAGLLKRKKQPSGRAQYVIEYAETQSPKTGLRDNEPESQSPTGGLRHGAESGLLSNIDIDTKKELKKDSVYSFEDFWSNYPNRVNKKKAGLIYGRLSEKARAAIKADLPLRAQTDTWQRGFIPHPTTYLNGERWEDEITNTGGSRQTVLTA